MKNIFLLVTAVFSLAASAQMKEGRIVYERVAQLAIRSFANLDPELAKQIPKARTDQYELMFANNQSLWQYLPTLNEGGGDVTVSSGGVQVQRMSFGANDIAFFDFNNGTRVDQRELFDRNFLVSDSINKLSWKLTSETKTILDHTCYKATSTRISTRYTMSMENGEMKRTPVQDTAAVVAWFTTDIPVPVGPEYQGQLPGAVLELDISNGQTVYKALEISPKGTASKIKAPKDGKKVTAAEFTKEREKLMEEMRSRMPNGGNMQIRMQ
jgi:GLPGLI family protein